MDTGQRAAAEAVARERALAAFEPQPSLLPEADLGLPATVTLAELRARRGPGRPPGSRNRRAEEAAREAIERLGDPLIMLVALAMTPVDELVAAGLKLGEALAEKRLSAQAALPYLHQRQAIAVNVAHHKVVHLTITTGSEQAGEVLEAVPLDVAEIVENQRVADGEAGGLEQPEL